MDELRRMADDTQPDIIGITETWTKPDMGDAEFGLAGYKMFRKDRLVKRGGGGGGDVIFQRTYSIQSNSSNFDFATTQQL